MNLRIEIKSDTLGVRGVLMNKKTTVFAAAILVGLAIIAGFILVNKGDGPVMGVIISDRAIENMEEYSDGNYINDSGLYVAVEKEYNKFKEKFKTEIPAGKDLYANVQLVESPKGSKFTAKWISAEKLVKVETKELTSDKKGTISFILDGDKTKSGKYTFELTTSGKEVFKYEITIK